jgi:hypothetical protein
MPALQFTEQELHCGRDVFFEFALFDEDGSPVVLAALDIVHAVLSQRQGGTATLALDTETPLAGGSEVVVESLGASKTPSATNTGTDTVDFAAAHGWATGTKVFAAASFGGLVAGTPYYVRAVDTDTVSFHLTPGDAEANTNLVDLTATITQALVEPASGYVFFGRADTDDIPTDDAWDAAADEKLYWLDLSVEYDASGLREPCGRGRLRLKRSPS